MRVPQVSERIKEAPAQALRGVFAGIGQLLLITDKLRNKTHTGQDVPPARAPEPSETATDAAASPPEETVVPAPAATAATETVTEASTEAAANEAGTATEATAVAEATAEPVTEAPAPAESPREEEPAPAKAAAPKPARATRARTQAPKAPGPPKPQKPRDLDKTGNVRLLNEQASASAADASQVTAAETPVAEAPLANYDELSVASLRARLRNLDVAQVRQLAEYERAHAARADVITMFERRIAKLEAEA